MRHTITNPDSDSMSGTCAVCGENTPLGIDRANGRVRPDGRKRYDMFYCLIRRREVARESLRRRRQNSDFREIDRRGYLAKHGITLEQFNEMWVAQGEACAICRRTELPEKTHWAVDHNHACCPGKFSCGKCVRGVLCPWCNTGLGGFGDSEVHLQAAIDYLRAHKPI